MTIYLSQVYKAIPLSQRICGGTYFQTDGGCGKSILRNACLLDGVLFHFGCIKKRNVQPTHMCSNCGSFLSPKNVVTIYVKGEKVRSCKLCGSTEVSWLGWKGQQKNQTGRRQLSNPWPDPDPGLLLS